LEELVFAIPSKKLWKLINYKESGLIIEKAEVLKKIIQNGLFHKRSELEENPSFKQIIPYAIISNEESFYLFKRLSGQVDKRLHNKLTLGVGGHMNPIASKKLNEDYPIHELKREFFEELKQLDGCKIDKIEFIGFINDDTIPVGKHHMGILYHIHLSNKNLIINEKDKMTADWRDKHELAEFYEGMETWTKIAYDYYIK
jgi:predicted NUDIX family phosphoesterase